MTKPVERYVVWSSYRRPNGEWYGSTDPDPDDLWWFIRDTAEDAPDWCEDDIAPGPYLEDVEATCKLLNHLARAARPTLAIVPKAVVTN